MKKNFLIILLHSLAMAQGNFEANLPICPTNIEFFPQNLPMHCRLPKSANLNNNGMPNVPTVIPPFPPGFQSPPPGGQPAPIPVPFPSLPGGLGMPGQMPGSMVGPMQSGMPMPMPGPMPGPMPMVSMGGPNHKLPVIVMPFYSPDPGYKKKPDERPRFPPKKRRKHQRKPLYRDSSTDTDTDDCSDTSDTDTDSSSDTSSDHETWKGWKKGWKKNARKFNSRRSSRRKYKKKKELLTPVLQYVTKDGYVIFEKKISKGEASTWLKTDDGRQENINDNEKQERNEQREQNNDGDDANDNEDDKKNIDTTTTISGIRPKRHRQFHKDDTENLQFNYEQM